MKAELVVVGLGRVGAPLALLAADRGTAVVGLDTDRSRAEALASGRDPFGDEADLQDTLARTVANGLFTATADPSVAIPGARWIIVAVPLRLTRENRPDFEFLDAAVAQIGRYVTAGTTVIFETTQPVGTTQRRHAPHLAEMSGLTIGEDLFVAFSPERIKVGHVFRDLDRYPKIVGGVDEASTEAASGLYRRFLPDVWTVRSAATAEFVKLADTVYRDLNIALVHELADAADRVGVDFAQVLQAANSQPESDLHTPGIGVGGHCIPVYPYLFMHNVDGLDLIAHGRQINETRPGHYADVVERVAGELRDLRIVVLGAAYRPELGLIAYSSAFELIDELTDRGAIVEVIEPFATLDDLRGAGLVPGSTDSTYDVAILHTAHEAFKDEVWHGLAPILIDGRGLLSENPPKDVRYLAPGFLAE